MLCKARGDQISFEKNAQRELFHCRTFSAEKRSTKILDNFVIFINQSHKPPKVKSENSPNLVTLGAATKRSTIPCSALRAHSSDTRMALINTSISERQGDQTSLCKNRPKCSPIHFCLNE
jgi:hypothetical protein